MDSLVNSEDKSRLLIIWQGEQGFKCLLFWDTEILKNIEEVLESVSGSAPPSPRPFRQGRGEAYPLKTRRNPFPIWARNGQYLGWCS
jgi:hypothetical protein